MPPKRGDIKTEPPELIGFDSMTVKPTENCGTGAYYAVPVAEDGAVNVSV